MNYLKSYVSDISDIMSTFDSNEFLQSIELITATKAKGGKLVFVGNGGSAAIASHLSVDFTKACNIRGISFNEADLLTCFSNDFGYENWVVNALQYYVDPDDLVFLISSSGKSKNIVKAAEYCRSENINLITLSGFSTENPLRQIGNINIYADSDRYNYVEMVHHIWLVALVDYLSVDKS